jgi:uncharacterized membrane protein YhaH (DUF805 family)
MDWNYLFTTFDGRINRQPFWAGTIVLLIVNLVGQGLIQLLFGEGLIGVLLSLVLAIAVTYASFAVLIKRCHDRGKSGWWSLLALIPLIGLIWVVIDLGILEGSKGPNQYGPDPLAGERIA